MADNTTLPAGVGGDTVRDIDRAGIKTQVVQLDVGGAASESLVATGNPLPVSGTVTTSPPADASTNLTKVGGTAVTLGAKASVSSIPVVLASDEAALPVSGTVTANQGTAAALASAWPHELTDGTTGPVAVKAASTAAVAADKAIVVAVSPNNSIAVTQATATNLNATVTGTVTTTPPANASTNITQVASTALGTPQTFGTAPTGVVVGTSSDIYLAGTRARSNQTTTAAGAVDVNVVGSLGVTNSVTNGTFAAITDNTTKAGVIVATTALKTDLSSVAATATVTAAAGVQRVGVAGNANAILDAVITAATAPANGLATLVENVTTAPSLTTGQSVMAQCDYQGSQFVKPYRRGQTGSKATAISATGATTIVAAQAAGIFADISTIVITTAGLAAQTITISDGTLSWVINFPDAAVAPAGPFVVTFNPPLAATTAATAWTANQSLATACNYLVTYVLQKAS